MIEVIKPGIAYEATDTQFASSLDYCEPCNNLCD